ncbi:MAG: T9SS type A sorting domain-containing protein [Aureispira sp.]|nr:T9SS type A sorting domain-containing protein [Aureispira sp.]
MQQLQRTFKLIFSLLILLTGTSFAQYHLDSTSTWVYHRNFWDGPNGTYIHHSTVTLDGDTTIQGITYFKEYSVGVDSHLVISGPPVVTNYSRTLRGFIRDDVGHFYRYINGVDSMVFDFTKQVGDSLFLDNCADSISEISTAYLGSTPLKEFKFYSYGIHQYIEGIGSTIKSSIPSCLWTGHPPISLVCYEKQGERYGSATNCNVYTSVSTIENKDIDIRIYPNPVDDRLTIDFRETVFDGHLNLYSLEGKLIQSKVINDSEMTLNLESYSKGMYILKIRTPEGILTKKIMKH